MADSERSSIFLLKLRLFFTGICTHGHFSLSSSQPEPPPGRSAAIELEHLASQLELIHMSLGDCLCEAGRPLSYAYFPISAIISLHHILENGSSSASASVCLVFHYSWEAEVPRIGQ